MRKTPLRRLGGGRGPGETVVIFGWENRGKLRDFSQFLYGNDKSDPRKLTLKK
jgi:archaellum biogenesis ATPase FlaH